MVAGVTLKPGLPLLALFRGWGLINRRGEQEESGWVVEGNLSTGPGFLRPPSPQGQASSRRTVSFRSSFCFCLANSLPPEHCSISFTLSSLQRLGLFLPQLLETYRQE